jgi:hypothetical protein
MKRIPEQTEHMSTKDLMKNQRISRLVILVESGKRGQARQDQHW